MREKAGWQVSFWHFRYSLKQLRGVEHMRVQPGEGNHSLGEGEQNCDITFDEVSKAIDSAKLGKAFLFVPNEALKYVQAKTLLRNSASIFHWLSSSIFSVRLLLLLSRIGNTSSHLHYMMFQTIQTIYFL